MDSIGGRSCALRRQHRSTRNGIRATASPWFRRARCQKCHCRVTSALHRLQHSRHRQRARPIHHHGPVSIAHIHKGGVDLGRGCPSLLKSTRFYFFVTFTIAWRITAPFNRYPACSGSAITSVSPCASSSN